MSSFFVCNLLLLLFLVYADSAYSQVHYYVTPSLNIHCPVDHCLTLAQFAADFTSYLGNETNISLSFLPGNHSLDRELSLSHADNFSMTKDIGGNGTVFIECSSQSGRFNISEIAFTKLKGLHFIGCGGNRISRVEQFIVEDTIFQGEEGSGTALVLNKVTDASIERCSFLSNTYGSTFDHLDRIHHAESQELLNYLYQKPNPSFAVGGALYTAFCNLLIVSSKFTDNIAEIGGALFAYNSSLHVVGCTYSYNRASFGGVMTSSESSVEIDNSSFSENRAEIRGGVTITYRDSFSISGTTFTNNSAGIDSGVMETYKSLINITNGTFNDNTAIRYCGVIHAVNGSFIISSSTFTNNFAARGGGGALTTSGSSLNITSTNFTRNSAADWGGVMDAFDSSFTIINSTFINNSAAHGGGVMYTSWDSSFNIISTTFIGNSATDWGGVMDTSNSSLNITNCTFINNIAAGGGGVMRTFDSSFDITNSTFTNNSAARGGGVIFTSRDSSFTIICTTFTNNNAVDGGGVMRTFDSLFNITNSTFTNNSAARGGGVMYTSQDSSFNIICTTFTNNKAADGGGVMRTFDSSFNITNSTFTSNNAAYWGGVMDTSDSSFTITYSTFTKNRADYDGGVTYTFSRSLCNITSSTFADNSAAFNGGVMYTFRDSSFNITNSIFTNNSAAGNGGVTYATTSSVNIVDSNFYDNKANSSGGIMFAIECFIHITDSTFDFNSGSLYIFNSNLTLSGYTHFENCAEPSNKMVITLNISTTVAVLTQPRPEGGAITCFQSTLIFTGLSSLSNNQARCGGAILATESKIIMYGETMITNNTATDSSGGGASLQQSDLEIKGNCTISANNAMRGGGIHATSSTIAVYQPGTLHFINNKAVNGSGLYLEVNARLYILKSQRSPMNEYLLIFQDNYANYGGAMYVADDTNSGACSPDNECFIQTLSLHQRTIYNYFSLANLLFSGNTASEQGANLFGGLLDRCIPSPFAEVFQQTMPPHYYGVSYLGDISNLTALVTISSLPVRVCFCKNESEPDCTYLPPTINVKKEEAFTVPLVAVDQINQSVDANIISSLSSQDGGFSEGQQIQSVGKYCSNVAFNVLSPYGSVVINLFADGPCGSSILSTRHLYIQFTNCTCPVGFEPLDSDTRCECLCDSRLSPHITTCNSTTESLVRVGTNSWIIHINDTNPPGYVIHPYCPFDYCQSPSENVSMNLNLPNGADAQCAYDRSGVLCGACQEYLSLSLGSSRCLHCHSYWPAVLVVILLAAIIAGILLVTALLALNLTVAGGLINGFIFYANIVAANSAILFPSSEPSFPTVFVAWLNLDIGIDVCFFDGLDAYTKTWLQMAFPVYIISLVIIVIIVSEYSLRFAGLIGKRDPVATLATLILLSYAKLLSVTITALSFAVLDYPDGPQTVWLLDGNVKYFQGKHVALVLVALLIILFGVPYTILLFLWQWLVCAPKWKVFKWTRNTKLNAFVSVHHVPYNNKYRYWTGLLLLLRVVLYITASVTISADPQTSLLVTILLVSGLFIIKEITGTRMYKKSFVNVVEIVMYINLLALSALSWYQFKKDVYKQRAVAYTSTIITFILLGGVIIYHVYLLIRKDQPQREEVNEYPLAPFQSAKAEVTHSVVEIPNTRNQSPSPEADSNEIQAKPVS